MYAKLLLNDLQQFHGASLNANAAGNALGSRTFRRSNHDLHGANFNALAAGSTQLLIDHIDTGLGILSDRTGLANLSTLATLDAGHGLSAAVLAGNDTDAGQILIKYLVESIGASLHALQASHALNTLFNSQLLHKNAFPFFH